MPDRPRGADPAYRLPWRHLINSKAEAGSAAGFAGVFAVTALLVELGRHVPVAVDLVVLAAVTAAIAMLVPLRAALFTGAFAWLCLNGFLINRGGSLSWHGAMDGWRLLDLLATASVAALARVLVRVLSARRRHEQAGPDIGCGR
ncbi:MAG: hypothetical protein ACXVXQ_06560 [Mycobacteriaceae bacterium]